MRCKRLKLSAILLLGIGLKGLQAQNLYVKESGGTQIAYALNDIRKMSFSFGSLTITETDNSSGKYDLNSLRYLNFSDLMTGLEEYISNKNQSLIFYPNPVNNVLNIDLSGATTSNGIISILSIEGKEVITQHVKGKGIVPIDLSQLPKGIYLCRYSNASEVKTVKIIKQ